jgi:protoheme IX farnesyltransferase
MIAQAAATGSFGSEGLILFAIIFVWTPPHFWALALLKSSDYARAGIPMLPVVAGEAATRRQIFAYAALLAPLGVAPFWMGFGGYAYLVLSTGMGAAFLWFAWRVLSETAGDRAKKAARDLFLFSILYLFALFATLLVERSVAALLAVFGGGA